MHSNSYFCLSAKIGDLCRLFEAVANICGVEHWAGRCVWHNIYTGPREGGGAAHCFPGNGSWASFRELKTEFLSSGGSRAVLDGGVREGSRRKERWVSQQFSLSFATRWLLLAHGPAAQSGPRVCLERLGAVRYRPRRKRGRLTADYKLDFFFFWRLHTLFGGEYCFELALLWTEHPLLADAVLVHVIYVVSFERG